MAEKTTSPEFFANILNKRLVEKRQDVRDHPIPFSHQFQSGTTLSTGLWNGIQIFEKEKCYVRAVLALVQLLEVGFTPHRRAKYWDRLRIDLIHLSRLHKIDELANLVDKVKRDQPAWFQIQILISYFNWLVVAVLAHYHFNKSIQSMPASHSNSPPLTRYFWWHYQILQLRLVSG